MGTRTPGAGGCPGRGGAKSGAIAGGLEGSESRHGAMAGAVVSYSSYVPPGVPKPPIKSCETVQPRLSWVGASVQG